MTEIHTRSQHAHCCSIPVWDRDAVEFAVALLVIACLLLLSQAASANRAYDLLHKSTAVRGTVYYSARVRITMFPEGHGKRTFVQKVLRAKGNRKRVEVIAPAAMAGRLTVSNGFVRWEYLPHRNVVRRYQLQPLAQLRNARLQKFESVRKALNPAYEGRGTIAGQRCHIISVSPSPADVLRKKVWLDVDTYVRLKAKRYDYRGKLASIWAVESIDYSTRPSKTAFEFDVPEGSRLVEVPPVERMVLKEAERRAGFDAKLPDYIPHGFVLQKEQTGILGGANDASVTLWLPFSNGLDTFSLFQSRQLHGHAHRPKNAVYWEKDGFSFLLTGDLPVSEKQHIRRSTLH